MSGLMTSQLWNQSKAEEDPLNEWISHEHCHTCHVTQNRVHYLLYLYQVYGHWTLKALRNCTSLQQFRDFPLGEAEWSDDLFNHAVRPKVNDEMNVMEHAMRAWSRLGFISIPESE